MIKRLSHAWTLALGVLSLCALSSCDSAKKTNYLQDIEIAKAYGVKHDTGIVVQKGDKLRILVTSIRNPELTGPLQYPSGGSGCCSYHCCWWCLPEHGECSSR